MDTNSTTQHTPSQPTNLINCQTCRMSNLCLPLAIDAQELYKLDELIRHSNPLQPRETYFFKRYSIYLNLCCAQRLG